MSPTPKDILVDIADQDLPELLKLYQNFGAPAHIPSFIDLGIKWKQSEKYAKCLTFMSPRGCWRSNGTIIVLVELNCYDLVVFTLDNQGDSLYEGLMETERIDFKRRTLFYSLHPNHIHVVDKFIKDRNMEVLYDTPCTMYVLDISKALNYSIESSPDVTIKKLQACHAERINSLWHYKSENSEKYIAGFIEINGGYGVFSKDNQLLAWVLKATLGHLALLYTEESHQKRGYALMLAKTLSKEIAKDGHQPYATVVVENVVSHNLFKKLGFHDTGICTFRGVQQKLI